MSIFRFHVGLSLATALMFAAPAHAQFQSQGYKFLEAVKKHDGDTVEKMLSSSGSKSTPGDIIINARDITTGDSALHLIIGQRDIKWLTYLVAKGADVNLRNFRGTTPLWLAINTGFIDGASLLIAQGALVNNPGPAGETPLIAAVHQRNLELVRTLIKAGANPVRADNSGRTAIDYAKLSNSSLISTELETAAKAAKVKAAKSYGPSF